ncbi:MAG: SIS domain-containing protein [Actinobacteria bacterium]|nr:SIS domain-containing protein [Actinomycetota bacterium]
MKPDLFEQDLLDIPARLNQLADRLDVDDPWAPLASHGALLTGMGSSQYAARTAAGWLRHRGASVTDEIATTDPGWPGGPGTSAILISASGGSAETLDRASRLAEGTQRVALVNTMDSALARRSDALITMHAGPEPGEVACRTYRHTIALLLALAFPRSDIATACRAAAQHTSALLADTSWLDAIDEILTPTQTTYWIAPENRIGSALQSALMMREVPRRPAVGCETGDWSHVDVYLTLTTEYRCVVFTGSSWDSQAVDWLTKRGSHVVSIGDALGVPGEFNVAMPGNPFARMLCETLIAELLALRWWRRDPIEAA